MMNHKSIMIDLTHPVEAGMPVYPGTEAPLIETANTVKVDGFAEKKLHFYSHTGTHMDAPAHMIHGGKTLDSFNPSEFCGRPALLDVSREPPARIGSEMLAPLQDQIRSSGLLVIRTGWYRWWGDEKYYHNFPVLSSEAAHWLVENGLRGIGIDAISVDPVGNDYTVHHILLGAGCFIIENLTNLNQVDGPFHLYCLPMKITHADGAPARVVAVLE
jgi:kynurenine formamidase